MAIDTKQRILQNLPGVDTLIETARKSGGFESTPRSLLIRCIRQILQEERDRLLAGDSEGEGADISAELLLKRISGRVRAAAALNLRCVVNAAGVVVHTNLGRSLLAEPAVLHLTSVARRYSNLEFDLSRKKRGLRYTAVEAPLCELTGAEAGMVVNNNAAAVLLCLETVAAGLEVIVSRGELVEIGGSFRIPDVMAKSGARLVEVGTTNRTRLSDYENAVTEQTGLLLKVHRSNFSILGFTEEVSLPALVGLGKKTGIPVMEDLGSGTFIDFSRYDMMREPTVQSSVSAGADLVTFSGDKLLGGPQAGLIVGGKDSIARIRENPLTRALRIDRLTLAALESTLRLYRDEETAMREVPTLRMLTQQTAVLEDRARRLKSALENLNDSRLHVTIRFVESYAGGGALPLQRLESRGVAVEVAGKTVDSLDRMLRTAEVPVIGRIEDDVFVMDVRCIHADEIETIVEAFREIFAKD